MAIILEECIFIGRSTADPSPESLGANECLAEDGSAKNAEAETLVRIIVIYLGFAHVIHIDSQFILNNIGSINQLAKKKFSLVCFAPSDWPKTNFVGKTSNSSYFFLVKATEKIKLF